eukprot:223055-Hanusia_phi.AAC.2
MPPGLSLLLRAYSEAANFKAQAHRDRLGQGHWPGNSPSRVPAGPGSRYPVAGPGSAAAGRTRDRRGAAAPGHSTVRSHGCTVTQCHDSVT